VKIEALENAKGGMVRRALFMVLGVAFVGCSSGHTPYSTRVGLLEPTSTLTVAASNANVNVYKPAVGQASDQFTVSAMALPNTNPAPPTIGRAGNGVVVRATDPLYGLLVRLPDRVNLVVQSTKGNINVTDVTGAIDVRTGDGNVRIMVPGVAQAQTTNGNIDATIGATQWKGTLKFVASSGDVTVYIPEIAKFHARLHTDNGTIFTDFGLRGTSVGNNETIDAPVNGGGAFGVDIESHNGTVRLLRLTPQA
jgi:Putative adhesin